MKVLPSSKYFLSLAISSPAFCSKYSFLSDTSDRLNFFSTPGTFVLKIGNCYPFIIVVGFSLATFYALLTTHYQLITTHCPMRRRWIADSWSPQSGHPTHAALTGAASSIRASNAALVQEVENQRLQERLEELSRPHDLSGTVRG